MSQLEENLLTRLARLEKMLEAYRKLHADELDEIGRELGELRQAIETLATASAPTPDRPALDKVQPPCAIKAVQRTRWPSPLRMNG
ncbi:MAG: hypothetical protein HY679_12025 [Chloroflexi bacterium]|nr:hypothetical protein [Chloroflexota bacterium]